MHQNLEKIDLFAFIDEGGNLDYSDKGTPYFTLTALIRLNPHEFTDGFIHLKYDLWKKGIPIEYFHASEDNQAARLSVINFISEIEHDVKVIICYTKKDKLNQNDNKKNLYLLLFERLIELLINHNPLETTGTIHFVTDAIPEKKQRKELEKAIKLSCAHKLKHKHIAYSINHFQSKSDINLQLADYLNWTFYRKLSKEEPYFYSKIEKWVSELREF